MATNTYVALATQTLGSAASSVTFSSVPSGYTDLRIVLANGNTNNSSNIAIQFNSVTSGGLYSNTNLYGNGSSAGSNRLSSRSDGIYIDYNVTFSSASNATIEYDIMNYSNSTTYKTVLGRVGAAGSATEAAVGTFRSTNAITDITITTASANTFSAGTTFALYGVAAAPVLTAKATGGTIYYGADGYVYHKFTGSGTFTPSQSLTVDALVVAGGGAGGIAAGGYAAGGGAGGLVYSSGLSVSATGYTVTVGAGGTAGSNTSVGGNGTASVFSTATAVGGGGGAGDTAGSTGGSGGGAMAGLSNPGAGTFGQGYAGGSGGSGGAAGGGGGAGGLGSNGVNAYPYGVGGVGSSAYSTWGIVTSSGQNVSGTVYYAGGGGGCNGGTGGTNGYTQTSGGYGGGGLGGYFSPGNNGSAGTANTGGGGGGQVVPSTGYTGYAGGSGIVIIRYLG